MSLHTFRQAIKLAEHNGENVCLGGGEPTIHPHFAQMLLIAFAHNIESIEIITNGKLTETALGLLNMSKHNNHFNVLLSQTDFHESIDKKVFEAYEKAGALYEVETKDISLNGRGNDISTHEKHVCCCSGPFVVPEGTIYQCGCQRDIIGYVHEGYALLVNDYGDSECSYVLDATTTEE